MKKKMDFKIQPWHKLAALLAFYDVVAIHAAYFAALWLRFDGSYSAIPEIYLQEYIKTVTLYSLICVLVFGILRLYRIVWSFASVSELIKVAAVSIFMSVVYAATITVSIGRMPLSFYMM